MTSPTSVQRRKRKWPIYRVPTPSVFSQFPKPRVRNRRQQMGRRGSDSVLQKSAKKSRELKEIAVSPETMGKRGSDSVLQRSAKKSRESKEIAVSPETTGKRESDSVLQRSAKKSRELKNLGLDGTLPRLGLWMDSDDEEQWKQNRQSYSSDDEDNTFSPEDEADYRLQCREHGETGLQYYNKKHRTNYELVDALDQVVFLDDAIWVHCNFTAKPQMEPNGDMDAQAQLFFAEMHYSNSLPQQVIVVNCRLLKEGRTKTSDACLSCGGPRSLVAHPTNGFRRGYSDLEARTRTLRSRSRR